MNVLRLHAGGDLRLHQEPKPVPADGEVLVRVTSVGLCGSDLHWFDEAGIGDAQLDRPLVLGHECAGVIASGERSGQRVAIDPAVPCTACVFCREGHPNLCETMRFAGHSTQDGGLQEYMAWPSDGLVPVPDGFTDEEIAMLEPLGVAIHAVSLGKVEPAMTVGIFGCGPIGLLILQVAKAAGATRIVATDKHPHRLEAARALGATAAIEADAGREQEAVWEATGGEGVTVAFEAATENAAVETAIAAARPGGRVVLTGIPSDDRTAFQASVARRKGLTLKLTRRMKHTYPRAIELVERGRVDVRALVSHRFPLEQADEAFGVAQRRAGLKVVIEPT